MKRIMIIFVLLAGTVTVASAQENAVAVLEFATDLDELQVLDRTDFEVDVFLGIGLSPGDRIVTGETAVELRLDPNGSIIRIAPQTTFELNTLQGRNGARETRGTIRRGASRLIAARSTSGENFYSIRTRGAVAGVRGTDFGIAATPATDGDGGTESLTEEVFVFEGEVIVTTEAGGREALVSGGQGIAVGDDPFVPEAWGPERVSAFEEPLRFEHLDPLSVPVPAPEPTAEAPEEREAPDVSDAPTPPVAAPPPERVVEQEPGFGDRLFGRMAQITGLQVGSVTINRQTYGQVVFQPRVTVGKLDLWLYLPIIYNNNVFDPNDWYRPQGNNEWSFGSDQDWSDDPEGALQDLATDIALKIRYLKYGDLRDPFFFKFGNLDTFTVGQGLLMRNYANDSDFPAIRRMGFNLGIDRGAWGFETFINDLFDPSIYGGRLYFRPAAPVIPAAVGFSAITDVSPAGIITDIPTSGGAALHAAQDGDPVFVNVAADLEIPFIRWDILSLIGYAEAGGLVPYVRSSTELGNQPISSGIKTNALVEFESGKLKNYGWTTGVRGNVTFLDYRLEYQYYDGTFRPGFYGPTYDRMRGNYAAETMAYLADPDADQYKSRNMAVAGELGANIFDVLYLGAGYIWPWEISPSGSWTPAEEDELMVRIDLRKGIIPLGIGAGLEYRRRYFAPTVANWGGFSNDDLFDANTTLDAYVSYPLTSFISIVARVSTAVQRDAEGEVVYDDDGRPKMAPMVVIQTEIGL